MGYIFLCLLIAHVYAASDPNFLNGFKYGLAHVHTKDLECPSLPKESDIAVNLDLEDAAYVLKYIEDKFQVEDDLMVVGM